jgi:secreted trypsin-like serine protease
MRNLMIALFLIVFMLQCNSSNNLKNTRQKKNTATEISIPPDLIQLQPQLSRESRTNKSVERRKNTTRIYDGVVSAGRPFMAALLYEEEGNWIQYCGASVISDRWLVTAAHCKAEVGEKAIISRSDLKSNVGGLVVNVVEVKTHPSYTGKKEHDLALVRVSVNIPKSIPRISIMNSPPIGTRVFAAGWGEMENKEDSAILLEVDVPVVGNDECIKAYARLTDNMMCAGEEDRDTCQGDSGGPLFLQNGNFVNQYGITSFGDAECGKKGFPGVYTRVANYREWIATQIK